jgi:polyvinyl alcohol dehydrogenase (cytochrome)
MTRRSIMPLAALVSFVISVISVVALRAQAPAPPAQAGPRLSESVGVAQYFSNCASCHESNTEHQAPRTAVLKQMTPEHIYESLTAGTMRANAANISDADKRLIAEWLAGRKIDTDNAGAAEHMPNLCAEHPAVRNLTAPSWNGWGVDYRNSRAQSARQAGLTPGQVSRLELKWAFGFPGATALYSQAVIDGQLFVSSNAGYVYSLDAETGCLHWSFHPQASVRSSFVIGRPASGTLTTVYFGDIHGMVYAVSAATGELRWKAQSDAHPLSRITGTPVLYEDRLYVPVTSLEEPEAGQAHYACCTFRGAIVALDAKTGRQVWKTYTIPETPKAVSRNSLGYEQLAPAGAGVWVTPALDTKRRALYFGTGNAFAGLPKTANAVMAVSLDTGRVLWTMQALPFDTWHNGCIQNVPGRAAGPNRGAGPARAAGRGGTPYPPENCPDPLGPDWDFAAPPALATTTDGRDIVIAAQKQGLVWALNPDTGAVLWKQDVAREIAGGRGETLFGGAIDKARVYFGLVSSGHVALDLRTGEEDWYVPLVPPPGRENARGVVGAVTLIPGVLLSGARDGMLRAASSKTGQLLWQFDTAREFQTVNGVAARGGSVASGGPIVVNGMVFVGSGYPGFQGGDAGNVLLAFAPAIRLDEHADRLKALSQRGARP